MLRQLFIVLTLSLSLGAGYAQAADPTLHQVYQAAEAGNLREARQMMDQVLKDHPNSAKAHYVEAELLARQGQLSEARTELATAERLAPGLPFAKADAVSGLRQRLGDSSAAALNRYAVPAAAAATATAVPGHGTSLPWGLILGALAFIVIVALWFNRNRRPAPGVLSGGNGAMSPASAGNGWSSNNQWGTPAAPGYGAAPQAPAGGMGSGLLGSLASGAAVGAGVVAGEALMHRILDGGSSSHRDSLSALQNPPSASDSLQIDPPFADERADKDFGVSDSDSWDDGAASSDDDWN